MRINSKRLKLRIKSLKVTVRCCDKDAPRPVQVSAASFKLLAASSKEKKKNQVFAASMANIEKALKKKVYWDLCN